MKVWRSMARGMTQVERPQRPTVPPPVATNTTHLNR
jgi:hypothetical protein